MGLTTLAVIPARGGSKGIKNKNIRDVGGKPMLWYQVQNGLNSIADKVVVSTDSEEIKAIASQWVDVIDRPAEISGDKSKTEETLLHALQFYDADIVVILQPTNVLNKPEYVNECIEMVKNGYDSAGCFTEEVGFYAGNPKELLERPMRQDKEPCLRDTGNCWATKVSILKETNNRLGGNFGIVVVPKEDSYEIDSETDWRMIETLVGKEYYTSRKGNVSYEEEYWGVVEDADGVKRDRRLDAERDLFLSRHKEKIEYIRSLPVGKIIDVGCGRGFLFNALDGWESHGVDISHLATESASGNIVCGTLEEANYESDYFDVAVVSNVIEHVKDPVSLLKETRRILKPKGKLIVETPDFGSAVAQRFGGEYRMLHDKGHITLFNILGVHRMLIDLMFEVENLSYPYFELGLFNEENLMRLFDTAKVSPPMAGNILTFYCYKK